MTEQRAQFDAYSTSYDDAVNRSLAIPGLKVDYFTRVKADYLLDILQRHFGETRALALVDIGCGVGNFHPLIRERLGSITGADVSAGCLETAAERNPDVTYRHYDGEQLPFDDGQFDAAVTICVMHHVPPAQWPAFAAEMKRVVRPGGLGVVFEHNPINPLTRRVVSNCEFDEDAVLLGQRRTRELIAGGGFRDVRSRAILSLPSFGPFSRKLDTTIGRLGLGAQYFVAGVA